MWQAILNSVNNGKEYQIHENGTPLNYEQVLEKWSNDEAFRQFYSDLLIQSSYPAFFWENPALTKKSLAQNYRFVLLNSSSLARVKPDSQTFSSYYESANKIGDIVRFPNLGNNAMLVVPCPLEESNSYPHFAAFIRSAPKQQIHDFWKSISLAVQNRLTEAPLWLSTSGLGVYWLHVRLDSNPKYYQHLEYKTY